MLKLLRPVGAEARLYIIVIIIFIPFAAKAAQASGSYLLISNFSNHF